MDLLPIAYAKCKLYCTTWVRWSARKWNAPMPMRVCRLRWSRAFVVTRCRWLLVAGVWHNMHDNHKHIIYKRRAIACTRRMYIHAVQMCVHSTNVMTHGTLNHGLCLHMVYYALHRRTTNTALQLNGVLFALHSGFRFDVHMELLSGMEVMLVHARRYCRDGIRIMCAYKQLLDVSRRRHCLLDVVWWWWCCCCCVGCWCWVHMHSTHGILLKEPTHTNTDTRNRIECSTKRIRRTCCTLQWRAFLLEIVFVCVCLLGGVCVRCLSKNSVVVAAATESDEAKPHTKQLSPKKSSDGGKVYTHKYLHSCTFD